MPCANKPVSADQPDNAVFSICIDGREISLKNEAWPGNRNFVYGKNLPVVKVPFAFRHFLAIFHPLPTWRSVQSMRSFPCFLTHWELLKLKKKKVNAKVTVLFSKTNVISLSDFLLLFLHYVSGQRVRARQIHSPVTSKQSETCSNQKEISKCSWILFQK